MWKLIRIAKCKTRVIQAGGQWLVIDQNIGEDRSPRLFISPSAHLWISAPGEGLLIFVCRSSSCETVCHSQSDIGLMPAKAIFFQLCFSPTVSFWQMIVGANVSIVQLFDCTAICSTVRWNELSSKRRNLLIDLNNPPTRLHFPDFLREIAWNERVRMFRKVFVEGLNVCMLAAINRDELASS